MHSSKSGDPSTQSQAAVSLNTARRIVIALVFPTMLMPFVNSMSKVALPVLRDHFEIEADMTAWVATAFSLPFMILTPVYGRLSDGLGKRGLILKLRANDLINTLAPTVIDVGR